MAVSVPCSVFVYASDTVALKMVYKFPQHPRILRNHCSSICFSTITSSNTFTSSLPSLSTACVLIMGLGILPDRHLTDVPGTSFLSEKGLPGSLEEVTVTTENHTSLKHDPTGKIVLVPQPSNDPNDPLNWPAWRKHMFTVSIGIGCGVVGAIGPLLGPAMVPLAEEFGVPLQRFTLGFTGSLLISLAFGNLFCNSLAMVVGKRPVYLITAVGLLVTTIWSAVAKDFISLAVSRGIQGFCMSPMEALVPASISDVWFVHQRGLQNAIFNLGVLGGINLASPIGMFKGFSIMFYHC